MKGAVGVIVASACCGALALASGCGGEAPTVPAATAVRGSWEAQTSGVQDDLKDVAFLDATTGFAVGTANTIVKTGDAGLTWRRVAERNPDGPHWQAVTFLNPREGWVHEGILGRGVAHTTDGGETWTLVPISPMLAGYPAYDTVSEGGYLLMNLTSIYRPGGSAKEPWRETAHLPRNDYHDLAFPDARHGLMVRGQGLMTRTDDGGVTWSEEQQVPEEGGNRQRFQFVDARTGWLLPEYGQLNATLDGGKTWTVQRLGHVAHFPLIDLHFVDTRVGAVLLGAKSQYVVHRTRDGGATWQTTPSAEPPGYAHALSFPGGEEGWIVGDKGAILHYGASSPR